MAVAYRAAVFDEAEGVIEDGAVVVRRWPIASVGPGAACGPGGGPRRRNAHASMIERAHVHLVWDASAEPHEVVASIRALTVRNMRMRPCLRWRHPVRDVGSTDGLAVEIGRAVELGILSGPRVVAAGRAIAMTGGHGWFLGAQAVGWTAPRAAQGG